MKSKNPTFISVAESLVEDGKARVLLGENATTLSRDYAYRLNRYCKPFFGKIRVGDVDARKLREFRDHLAKMGLKSSTILTVMSFVSKVMKLGHDDGLVQNMPSIPRPRQQPCPRPAFSTPQYRNLLKTLKAVELGKPQIRFKRTVVTWELRAIVTFMVNSFTRPGDIFALQNKHVTIVPAQGKDSPAYLRLDAPASKRHTYPIIAMPVAVKIYELVVKAHKKAGFGGPDDYVFLPERKNRAYAHEIVRRLFRQVLKEAGLLASAGGVEHTLYSLRHTAITMRLRLAGNLDLLTLARTCRTSVEMIDRYYASSLTAEANRDKLFSFRHPNRYSNLAA